jgi:hypothetical protein
MNLSAVFTLVALSTFWWSACFAVPFINTIRGPITPFLSGDTFRSYCDLAFDELLPPFDYTLVKPGSTIFVSGEMLGQFIEEEHPRIQFPYIIVVHNTDRPVPGPYKDLLDDPKIIAMFTQNTDNTSHRKLHCIPIGLENRQWNATNFEVLQRAKAKQLPKRQLLYCNFNVGTYPPERSLVHALFAGAPFCYSDGRKGYEGFADDIASSKFILCPRGNGLDTHRLWETLYIGSIPIVKASSLDPVYEGLPVLVVQEWSDVTEEFLHQKYEEFSSKMPCYDALFTDHWFQLIENYKKPYQNGELQ